MKNYELTYLISPDLSEEELKSLQEEINSFIPEDGGFLNEINPAVRKSLAYPIKKKKAVYLVNLDFQSNPEKLENLEKKLKAEEKIIRYLILIKKTEKKVISLIKPRVVKPKLKPKVELKEIEKRLEEILGEE